MSCIVINREILAGLGMSDSDIADLARDGLIAGIVVAVCFSFNAGGEVCAGRTQVERLESFAPDRTKRSLLLVGIADRYGAGEKFSDWVKEIGVRDHGPHPLTETERDRLLEWMWDIRVPCAAPLRDALERVSLQESATARAARAAEREYVVVTRHRSLVILLQERGHIGQNVTVIEHATDADVSGRHVIGILPMRMAALCQTYSECSLVLEPQDRGISDLPIERLREIAQPLTQYRVSQVPPQG